MIPFVAGYKPQPDYAAEGTHPKLRVDSGAPLPAAKALSRMYAMVLNQGQAGTCLTFAGKAAVKDRMACQRTEKPRYMASLHQYQARPDKTLDDGLYPSDWALFLASHGYCSEEHWPYPTGADLNDPAAMQAAVTATPPPEAMRYAYDQRSTMTKPGLRLHRVTGDRRVNVMRAICADLPGINGGMVDAGYQQYASGVWVFTGPSIGGHAREFVAYDSDGLWERGSYSDGFAIAPTFETEWLDFDGNPTSAPRGGFVHVAWETALNEDVTNDCWLIDWAPSYSEDNPLNA